MDRDAGLGAVADAATRGVENAPQTDRVTGVVQHPQISDDVANLLALVEPNAADHLVRDAGPDEHLLDCAGCVVGAVEHRDVPKIEVGDDSASAFDETVDLGGDEAGFVVLVVCHVADDLFPLTGVGPQTLLPAA